MDNKLCADQLAYLCPEAVEAHNELVNAGYDADLALALIEQIGPVYEKPEPLVWNSETK